MSQSTLDDDDLFGEAASEMRDDVERSLGEARAALPEPDAIWEIDGENTLGTLNTLKSSLEVGDARGHLRDAKKWFTMGQRAGAFDDGDDLAAEIDRLDDIVDDVEDAREDAAELASTLPTLRSALQVDDEA